MEGKTVITEAASTDTTSQASIEDGSKTTLQKAYRKVDYRVLLWYSFVYLIMRINVSNITNTAIINIEEGTGIKKQLGNLTSEQWAWAISIFFYPYMAAEPASTLLLKRFSPSVWMSRIMVTWGELDLAHLMQGLANSFKASCRCVKLLRRTTPASLPLDSSLDCSKPDFILECSIICPSGIRPTLLLFG
jgi:hypothetical protein